MDNESPVSRVERTFWTVWNYISGAVSRFLRPEPSNIVSNDPNSTQESAVDNEPANSDHAEGETSRREVDEEQCLARVSLLSSSRPVVGWELCTTEINLGPDEESMQHNTQLSSVNERGPSEEGEGEREEQDAQTGNDDAGLLVAKEDKLEENRDQKLGTRGRDETPESDKCEEHVNTRALSLTGDAEEETERALTPDDHQKMDKTMTKIQVTKEDDKIHPKDERDVEAEDVEVKLCTTEDMSLEEKDDLHMKKETMQKDKVDTEVMREEVEDRDDVLQLASENENPTDEEVRKVESRLSASEELSDDDRDFKGEPGITALPVELQMVSADEPIVVGHGQVMVHRNESDKAEDAKEKELESTSDEREQGGVSGEEDVNEAANSQTIDEVPEQDIKKTVTMASQDSHILTGHVTCTTEINLGPDEESMQLKTWLGSVNESGPSEQGQGTREEQVTQTGNDDAGLLVTKDDKLEENRDQKLSTRGRDETPESDKRKEHANTGALSLTGDTMSEKEAVAEEETERALTPDDHQKMDETMTKIQVTEEDNKIHPEDERDVEAEDVEVKLCTIEDMSLEEKDDLHMKKETMQKDKVDTEVMREEVEDRDDVLQLASENENTADEEVRKVESRLSASEELSDDDRDIKGEPGITALPVELQMVSEDEPIVVGHGQVIAHRNESDKAEDAKEKEFVSTSDEREQGGVSEEEDVNEAANSQTIDEVPEQDIKKTVTMASQDSHILTGHVTCNEEVKCTDGEQEDVAKDTQVRTKPKETDDDETESHSVVFDGKSDVTTIDFSVDEKFIDEDQVEEERVPSEVDDKESYMEVACTTTSVTEKPEGKTGQEIGEEFKNIPLGIFEGRLVVSRELNPPTCEETQEGVPEYNNEPGPDENTTQRFLEVGDCEEIQTTQLPEEVESKESESLQNSGCRAGVDTSLVREHMEEEQESRADIDLGVEDNAGILGPADLRFTQETEKPLAEPVIQESGLLFEEEEGKVLLDLTKTGIEHSEKEFEMHTGLSDETDKSTKELQDGTEELLVDFEIDEGLRDSREADAAVGGHEMTGRVTAEEVIGFTDGTIKFLESDVQKMPEMSFFQESVDAINSEQNSYKTHSLLEDFTESGFLKQSVETEPKLLEDSTVGMQDAGIDMEETGYGAAREAVEDDLQSKNEMKVLNLQVGEMAAELITEWNEKEDTLIAEYESLETKNQLLDEPFEISSKDTDESITTEHKPKDLTVISAENLSEHVTESEGSYAEETVSPIAGCQDVIEEEILDLWIQTALSEDTNDIKQQEGPEPEQQMDADIEPSHVEQEEISSVQTKKDKEQLVESHLGESEFVSDAKMSSSTAESGFLDQPLCEGGTQNSETQLLKSPSTGPFQGIYDMLANVPESADIFELSTQQPDSDSQDVLMAETAEKRQSYLEEEESVTEAGLHPDSDIVSSDDRHLNQESEKSQEETDKEAGSQKEIDAEVTDQARKTDWEDTEDADVKSLTEMSAPFEVKETEVEDEPLEITVSDSPDEIERSDSGRSRSGSEALLEEEIVSTESGSKDDTCFESEKKLFQLPSLDKPQPGWSEDGDSLLELSSEEVVPQQTTEFEDQIEVDASVLDCTAQRSRIAVKNPRVRPPKDPRSLLHMPSLEPTPSSRLPVKVPAGVPLGGLGIGIKLPGLGAGFPVLKKTQRVVKVENSPDTLSQEHEAKPVEKSDTPKQDEAQHKPKWMPPKHPGFGNPLMSELKTKLKKTTKE